MSLEFLWERGEVQRRSLCCRILVHSVTPSASPSSAPLQFHCNPMASLHWSCPCQSAVCSAWGSNLLCWKKEEIICLVVIAMMSPFQQVEHHGVRNQTPSPSLHFHSHRRFQWGFWGTSWDAEGRGLEQWPQNRQDRRRWLSSNGAGLNYDLGEAGATKILGL